MSTYLKTAAMSLLSKTLQTFLYKYLSDVDVEGVALPSVYDGSGWGVRLSNVQLREGVELIKKLPGKVTKRRKRKRKVRRRRKTSSLKQHHLQQDTQTEQLKRELFGSRRSEPPKQQSAAVSKDDQNSFARNAATDIHNATTAVYTTDEEDTYDSDTAARPTTPVQESKSMFSCFYNSRASSSSNNNNIAKPTSTTNLYYDHSLHNTTNTNLQPATKALHTTQQQSTTAIMPDKADKDENYCNDDDDLMLKEEEEDEEEDDYYDYEEYEEECEIPLRLCLGENGHIGTLDIRLIGKELHVMVEDAVVTIEAIPMLPVEEDEDCSTEDGDQEEATNAPGQADATANKSDSTTKPSSAAANKKVDAKRDTVGDRVLADNPLARLISSIPHLFLRDVRVRLVIRDEPMTVTQSHVDDTTAAAAAASTNATPETTPKPESSPKDILVEVGVDFLSVGSGEDILSHFQPATEEESQSVAMDCGTNEDLAALGDSSNQPPALLKIPSYASAGVDGRDQKNEFLYRHIRTGKGPSAGIFLQVFAPTPKLPKSISKNTGSSTLLWARQRWLADTDHVFLRCSGLDIQARIHLGTRTAVDVGYSWFGELGEDDGSDYDSMFLFAGMDTIAPGPQLPLPPMEPRMIRGRTPGRKSSGMEDSTKQTESEVFAPASLHPGAELYETDKNGIQSCKIPSTFHRISRGMEPGSCKSCEHLPSEICPKCWKATSATVPSETSLDSSMPMPGLVLQIGVRDPLEVNVDRNSLESLGLLKSLFTKPVTKTLSDKSETSNDAAPASRSVPSAHVVTESSTVTTASSTGFFSSMIYGTRVEEEKEEEPSDAFATYMQPENITIMGIYVSEISLRVHILKGDRQDGGTSFAYWHVGIDCLTLDRHTLIADEQTYQDLELDLGRFQCDEYYGVERKNVCTLGLGLGADNRGRCDSQTSTASMVEDHEQIRAPWPSTACALLDIPPPLESLAYKSRERHGLQLRFISSSEPYEGSSNTKSLVHARLGIAIVDTPLEVRFDFFHVLNEVMDNLVRQKQKKIKDTTNIPDRNESKSEQKKQQETKASSPSDKTWMSYAIQIDSGDIKLPPTVNLKVPLTRFCGEQSSEAGISFESDLNKLNVAYGRTVPEQYRQCLTLPQLSELPENARMHILLCLDDLSPLEKALSVKKEKNPFRRIKAVDKYILKIAKKVSKRDCKSSNKISGLSLSDHSSHIDKAMGNRRQQVLSEIMKMDDTELAELWSVHHRYQKKKLAKKRGDV